MTIYHILMFVAGGLVSAVIFYPHKKKMPMNKLDYMTTILSYQYHYGIYTAQHREPPIFESESQINMVALTCSPHFKQSAEHVLKSLEEL
jgi:hypothetical protein